MEKIYKSRVIKILENKFYNDPQFKNSWNLPNINLIKDVKNYLNDFIEADNKKYKIEITFIDYKKYHFLLLKENGKTIFTFDLSRNEVLNLI